MLKQSAKRVFYFLRFNTGLHRIAEKKNRRLVLMYHGISPGDFSAINGRHLPAQQFEKHLLYFKKNFIPVPLDELTAGKLTGKKTFISLTFDDGFENNFSVALPLLEKHKIPATFFIPAAALEKKLVLPSDIIDIVRWGCKEKELIFDNGVYRKKGRHRLLNKNTGENIYAALTRLAPLQVDRAIKEFCTRYNYEQLLEKCEPGAYRLMNAGQVKELPASLYVQVGSHAHSHCALEHCSEREMERELILSKQMLENCTGKKINSVAYPYGSYSAAVLQASRKAGYDILLAAGEVKERAEIIPRLGIISGGSFAQNMLHIHNGFDRFGF